MRHSQSSLRTIFIILWLAALGCSSAMPGGGTGTGGGGTATGGGTTGGGTGGGTAPQVEFNPVGPQLDIDLIDLDFLPDQNGDAIAITKSGRVYYLSGPNFQIVGSFDTIAVRDENESGLLNVEVDPRYNEAGNGYVYFFYTRVNNNPGVDPEVNRVERYNVNVSIAGDTFSLSNPQIIIEFPKVTTATNDRHNGGGMAFMDQNHLAVGVGDGITEDEAQDEDSLLGKIHRFIPNRAPGTGGIDPSFPGNGVGSTLTVYALGLRNPFTLVVDELDPNGDLFLGDVGGGQAEEINCVYHSAENYGWPDCEGPCDCALNNPPNCAPPFNLYATPIHFYLRDDETFENEDPEDNPSGPQSIMVNAFYTGDAYNGAFTGKIIYSEFFEAWVRVATLDANEQVTGTAHIGHQDGLITLQEHPVDGMLYGVGHFSSDRILRMDLAP